MLNTYQFLGRLFVTCLANVRGNSKFILLENEILTSNTLIVVIPSLPGHHWVGFGVL